MNTNSITIPTAPAYQQHQHTEVNDNIIKTNLQASTYYLVTFDIFKNDFINWINEFDKETQYDIFELLLENKIIILNNNLRLILFKKLYNSGFFCYNPVSSKDFKENFDYIQQDLRNMSSIVSTGNLNEIDADLTSVLSELYLFENITLKDVIL